VKLWKSGLVIGVVLTLAGCNREPPPSEEPAAKPVLETPKRQAGLWKQTMSVEGLDVLQSVSLCLDARSDDKIAWWSQQGVREGCEKNDVKHNPDGSWSFESVCRMAGGIKTTTVGRAVGDFSRGYQVSAETTTFGSPMPQLNGTRTITIDAQWLGECPDGMKPGDMELPTGQRLNVLEMTSTPRGGPPRPTVPAKE
jgi:hypothetical protein